MYSDICIMRINQIYEGMRIIQEVYTFIGNRPQHFSSFKQKV